MGARLKDHGLPPPEPRSVVAVVGLGLSLPGAATVEEFWTNILEGRRFFAPATALDWGAEPELFLQPGGPALDKVYSLNGAYNQRRTIDPQGLDLPLDFDFKSADGSLAFWLAAGRDAAAQAAWERVDRARVGVIAGHTILPTTVMAEAAVNLYTREATRAWTAKPQLKPPPPGAFRLLGYSARLLAQALGFTGEAFTIDAACASSLYAVHLAVCKLISGEMEAVITGGLAKADALFTQMGFCQLRALAASGALTPFDRSADGLIVGEGAVALVLKRLDRALDDGDEVLALIRGVGLSNDRAGNILAPQAEGQARAMRAAWRAAGLTPAGLGLIEAHGTGTILGDRVEVETIKSFLADPDFPRLKEPALAAAPVLGSVKSNIGHLLSAAGAAGLAKVVLALSRRTLPPTAGFTGEAPGLNLAAPPALRILTRPEPWPDNPRGAPRLAVVNAFGFGGVNAQVIVEEFVPVAGPGASAALPDLTAAPQPLRLLSALALSAPWPDFASLAQNWMDSEGPPIIATRRFGGLRATGLFFNSLVLEGADLRLAPKDLANILPQQALALKMASEALHEARLKSDQGVISGPSSPGLDKNRVGVYMGVDVDPRSADYAFRWLGPIRAAEARVAAGELRPRDLPEFVEALRRRSHPALTASRVMGALGSLVASRVARFVGSGGPAYTVTEEGASGLRALKLAMEAISRGEIDLALVGVVDTLGDPKTAALEPGRLWEEGAAMMVVASEEAALTLGRGQAPELSVAPETGGRLGGLGGLFPLVRNAFFIRHRLTSRGLGAGAAYWIKNRSDPPRRLESSGFAITEKGGEEVSSPPFSYEDATWFLIRARGREDGLGLLNRLEQLARSEETRHQLVEVLGPLRAEKRALKRLGDRFWSEYGGASGARPTLAILARSFDDLLELIKKARARFKGEKPTLTPDQSHRLLWALDSERVHGELAWVFPGSGGHYHGLGRRLAMAFPHLVSRLEDQVSRLADHFQSSVFWGAQSREITLLQAILGQVSFGLLGAQVLTGFKIQPQAVLGYSLGETTALLATGAWADRESLYDDLIKSPLFTQELAGPCLAARRYFNWPADQPFKWIMGVLPKPAAEIRAALERLPEPWLGRVFLLSVNSPGEGVVGGEESAVRALIQALGSHLVALEGVAAVHNPTVAAVAEEYRRFHTRPTTPPPGIRYYSAAWGEPYELTEASAAESLTAQASRALDLPRLIERAYADGVRFFVEVGPGAAASRLIGDILKGRPHLAASLAPGPAEEGWLGANRLLVELWMAGYPLKMSMLYPEATGVQPALPVNIALAPAAELWPEPDELAALRPEAEPSKPAADSSLKPSPARLDRDICLAFAVGRATEAFGPDFEEVDRLPSRVRLPDEPLMFVDRVLNLEGRPLSLGPGRIVTEHDIRPEAWYLDQGYMPAGLAIEAGQADLMLSGWLGVDLATRGLAFYRLLDAEVTFHRELPRSGETARYDIRLVRFFKYGQTHLFRFEYDGQAGGRPLLTMRGGCAGFFTPAELAGGRGLPGGGLTEDIPPPFVDPAAVGRFPGKLPHRLEAPALAALRAGDLAGAFGPAFAPNLNQNPALPGGRLALLDRVTRLEPGGGRGRAGFIRAELDINPRAWFLTSHFPGDEVMPGTLMYESCLQTLRVFLMASGWVDEPGAADWQPVPGVSAALKCRGQVTGRVSRVAYEVHLRRMEFKAPEGGGESEPVALAEAVMLADDRPIVEVRNLNLRLRGSSAARLRRVWGRREAAGRPSAEADPRTYNKARLLALAEGRPSEALGPAFARFDDGAFLARLPRPPYDFIDQATVVKGRRYAIEPGSEVLARYVVEAEGWLLGEAGGGRPALPYAVLNEIALQACGFLAAYMGSALLFDSPMHFRNLGGRATVLAEVAGGEAVDTRARFVRSNRLGEMMIQYYEFECAVGARSVYQGVTHFGFFSPLALARQAGLNIPAAPPEDGGLTPYPQGPAFPAGKWRLLEKIALDPRGGPEGLGSALAVTRVDPLAWFFKAHFHQDPVCPGSLGLESLIQAGKALAVLLFGAQEDKAINWAAPALNRTHEWLYRGQVTPDKKETSVKLAVRAADAARRILTVDGLLMADELPIYKMEGFAIGLSQGPVRRRIVPSPQSPAPARPRGGRPASGLTGDMILDWRKDRNQSQGQLAKLLGVTPIYISLMERGKRNISPSMAEKLSAVFKDSIRDAPTTPGVAPPPGGGIKKKGRPPRPQAALGLITPEELRARRQAKGLSQRKLAAEVGVTATLIGLIELGKRGLSLEMAQKILAVLRQ